MEIAGSFSLGKVAPRHDVDPEYRMTLKNVDPSLTKNNIVYIDELQGRTIEQYTNDEMQPFIDEYDANQKRKDRKIMSKYENYIDWHMSDKKMMKGIPEGEKPEWAYEFVLQYGNHEDYWHEYFDPRTSESRKQEMHDQADNEFKELIKEFKERYPHAHIALAAAHFDEPAGSGHLHLIVQFRPDQYERSLKTRVGVSRALAQDGFEYIQSATSAKEIDGFQMERLFKDFRHNVMNERIKAMGFDIKKEEKGAKHYDCPTYNKIMQQATQTLEDAERVREEAAKEATQTIEAAEVILKKAEEKAEQTMDFTKIVERVKEEVEKTIDVQDSSVIYETRKDSMFGEKYEVAVQRKEVYEAKAAGAIVNDAIGKLTMHAERIEMASKKAIEEIQTDGRAEAEREIERWKGIAAEREKTIKTLENKISIMQDYVDHILEFLKEINMVQRWQAFWNRITRNRRQEQNHEINNDERKDREL